MAIELPDLPYAIDALAPHISAETLEFHHGKHHAAYVTNLNGLIAGTDLENADLETIIGQASGGMFNNAAQIWNHTFYWNSMSPSGGGAPGGAVGDAINSAFGSYDDFRSAFTTAAMTQFGSGWAWLVRDENNTLQIYSTPNQDSPYLNGHEPVIGLDIWEHAYYLNYQNKRPDYVNAWWNVLKLV